jgi:hypothetical protein
MPRCWPRLLTFLAVAGALLPTGAAAMGLIAASRPEQGATVTGRKPKIVVEFASAVDLGSLVAVLDGTDVTQVAGITPLGLEYVPVVTLAPGAHTLAITARDASGAEVSGTLSFASRHTRAFEEVGAGAELGLNYEYAVRKPERLLTGPDAKFEANLTAAAKGRNGGLTVAANANLAYLQLQPATPTGAGVEPYPPEEEVNLMDYLVSAAYERGNAGLTAEVGTLQVDQTQRTISGLSRRGTRVAGRAGAFDASAFVISGESSIEFKDPAGMGGTDDHLYGVTAGAGFFDRALTLRGIYVKGGETGNSPGVAGAVPREGEVFGVVVGVDPFAGKLRLDLEADRSSTDADESAESAKLEDDAWSARASGTSGVFGYEAGYERRGRDFQPIGNLQLEPDRQIYTLGASATLPAWRVAVNGSRTEDNVEDDLALPQVASLQGTIDASYTGFANAPFGLSYQHNRQESSHDIEGTLPVDLTTGTLSGWANLTWGLMTLGLQASQGTQDDGNEGGIDTATSTFTVTPSFALGPVTLTPNYTFTRAKNETSGVAVDTQVAALDVRSAFFAQRLTFDVAASWSGNKADDATVDTTSVDANARLAYAFGPLRFWPAKGSVALKALYNRTEDKLGGQTSDDLSIYLAVTAAIPLLF